MDSDMGSHSRLRYRQCSGKVQFKNKSEAVQAIIRHGRREELNAYCCNFCHEWHIGHRPVVWR